MDYIVVNGVVVKVPQDPKQAAQIYRQMTAEQ